MKGENWRRLEEEFSLLQRVYFFCLTMAVMLFSLTYLEIFRSNVVSSLWGFGTFLKLAHASLCFCLSSCQDKLWSVEVDLAWCSLMLAGTFGESHASFWTSVSFDGLMHLRWCMDVLEAHRTSPLVGQWSKGKTKGHLELSNSKCYSVC